MSELICVPVSQHSIAQSISQWVSILTECFGGTWTVCDVVRYLITCVEARQLCFLSHFISHHNINPCHFLRHPTSSYVILSYLTHHPLLLLSSPPHLTSHLITFRHFLTHSHPITISPPPSGSGSPQHHKVEGSVLRISNRIPRHGTLPRGRTLR